MSSSNRDVGEPDIKPTASELKEATEGVSNNGLRKSTRTRRRRRHHDETSDDDDDDYQPQPLCLRRHPEESNDDDDEDYYQQQPKPKRQRRRHQSESSDDDDQQQQPVTSTSKQRQFFTYESQAQASESGATSSNSSSDTEVVEHKPPLNFWEQNEEGKHISNPIERKNWKEGNEELTKIFNYLSLAHQEKGRLTLMQIQTVLSSMTRDDLQKVQLPYFERNWDIRKMRIKKDEVGNKILKSFMDCGLEAYESKPDGNCLYNSLSISLFGHDSYTQHIRFQILKFYVDNYDHIKSLKENDFFWTEGIESSLSKCARLGCLGDVAALYCAARALSVTIRLIYPPINGFLDDWFLRVPKFFEAIAQPMAEVYLMWSSNTNRHVGYFKPNHFLPAFRNRLDSSRKEIDLSRLESSFSTFASNHAPSRGGFSATRTNGNDSSDQETDSDEEVEIERYRAQKSADVVQNVIDCSLTTAVQPYMPVSGVKEKIKYILEYPDIYMFIPECEKFDCQFIVLDTDSNKKFDDRVGDGWERVDRSANRFFDKSNNEFVAPSCSDDHEYVYKRRELIGKIPVEENVLHFYESNYIHKENQDYMRKIFVVGNLCFFQYVGHLDKSRNYLESYTEMNDEVAIIKKVIAFEPKSPNIPKGFKEDCQFVVIDGNEKKTFTDRVGPWTRTSRTCVRYFDQANDYQPIKTYHVTDFTNAIKIHSFKFYHKHNPEYFRDIHVVNDFVFFQYYGTPHAEVRDNFKKSLVRNAHSKRRPTVKRRGQMPLNVPQVAHKLLTDKNKTIDIDDIKSYGIYYTPGPKLTKCIWKHEKGHKCAIKITERNGSKQCHFTKDKGGPDVVKISHNVYYCVCNPDIKREVFMMAGKVLVKFFGTSPNQCTCDPSKSYEHLKAVVLKNLKVPTASIYMAHKDKFKNETQISNIKAKLNGEIHAVRNGLDVPKRIHPHRLNKGKASRQRSVQPAVADGSTPSNQLTVQSAASDVSTSSISQ